MQNTPFEAAVTLYTYISANRPDGLKCNELEEFQQQHPEAWKCIMSHCSSIYDFVDKFGSLSFLDRVVKDAIVTVVIKSNEGNAKFKSKFCREWFEGKGCDYKHCSLEHRDDCYYKTTMCTTMSSGGAQTCNREKCVFAHSTNELWMWGVIRLHRMKNGKGRYFPKNDPLGRKDKDYIPPGHSELLKSFKRKAHASATSFSSPTKRLKTFAGDLSHIRTENVVRDFRGFIKKSYSNRVLNTELGKFYEKHPLYREKVKMRGGMKHVVNDYPEFGILISPDHASSRDFYFELDYGYI